MKKDVWILLSYLKTLNLRVIDTEPALRYKKIIIIIKTLILEIEINKSY
jgi:hypothetical protein